MAAPFIIDVQPVAASSNYSESSSGAAKPAGASTRSSSTSSYRQASYQSERDPKQTYAAANSGIGGVVGGLAEGAAGTALVLIGIPMLILPGPGLLSMAAGGALIYDGIRRVTGRK